jgi:transposase
LYKYSRLCYKKRPTLIETARLNGLDPERYLREVITRIAGHPINRLDELLPWNITL